MISGASIGVKSDSLNRHEYGIPHSEVGLPTMTHRVSETFSKHFHLIKSGEPLLLQEEILELS